MISSDYKLIGAQLREARKQKNMTQVQLARHLGLHHQYIQRMEAGGSKIDALRLFHMARVLNVRYEHFFILLKEKFFPIGESKDIEFNKLNNIENNLNNGE